MRKMILVVGLVALTLNFGCSGTGLTPEASVNDDNLKVIPKLTISAASHSAVNQALSVIYQISYTDVSGVTLNVSDIILNTTGTATCSKSVTITGPSTANVTLSNCAGDGSVSFQVKAGSAISPSGGMAEISTSSAAFSVDNTGATSVSFGSPTGSYSAVPSSVVITFPEMMDGSSISAANFVLGGTCSGISIGSVTTSGATCTVNLAGTLGCTLSQTVSVMADLSAIQDALGNLSSGSFGATYTVDTVGPTSGTFSPLSGATISPTFNAVNITFSDPITPTSISVADFSISGTCSAVSISGASGSGSAATINLSGVSSCTNGQTVIVTANLTGIQDDLGNSGVGTASTTYTFDSVGPTASFGIASTAVAVIPATVAVTFSADTNMISVTAADFSVSGTCPGASLAGIIKVGVIATVQIAGGGTCADTQTVILTANLSGTSDLAGNAGSGFSSVIATLDTQGPSALLSLSSSNVIIMPTSITATFLSDTDMSTVTSADFSVSGTCGATLSSITKLGPVTTVNLGGTGSCTDGQTIIVTENFSGVSDLVGNTGSGSSSVTLTLDNLGPVSSFNIPNANLNPLPTSVLLTLSADTDMSTVTSADISVGGTCGATLGSLVKVGVVATINLSGTAGCTNGQTIVVTATHTGIADLLGNAGSGSTAITLTFDNVGPTVSLVALTGRYNPQPTTLIATFSADTEMSTVTSADFIVTGTCGVTLSSFSKSGQVATVNLAGTGSCLTEQTVIAAVNPLGVTDLAGNIGLNVPVIVTHTFDNVAPTALMLPLGIPMLTLPTSVIVTLDVDTDMSTVTGADFSIGGTCGATISSVTKLANVATVNLSGTGSCLLGTTIVVTTTMTGVQDQAINSGVGSQSQTFTQL